MGGGRIFLKTFRPLSLMKTYRMSLISAGSISLDSTVPLSRHWFLFNFYHFEVFFSLLLGKKCQNVIYFLMMFYGPFLKN